ncbi:MAG TPA: MFS transporter [Candidatus Binataceae bacterium]|nr:MFS transporter [Candidatus Binataceae bacterium]
MQSVSTDSPARIAPHPPGIPRPRRYLVVLFAMLMPATVFEGYDITIFHLCTPDIAHTFSMGDLAIGAMATIVRVGGVLSFFIVILADRYGRKPIISAAVLCYTLFTLFTALSPGMTAFTLFQSSAQLFLAAEFGVAVTMITEEFPDDWRGRAIAALHMVAFLGVTAAGMIYGYMAETRWGWRGMYLLGIAPLVLIVFIQRRMRETARFTAIEKARRAAGEPRPAIVTAIRSSIAPLWGPYRGRLLLVAALANSIGLIGGPTITFFSLYARRDHHWTSGQVGAAIIVAYLMGAAGSMVSGFMMDRIGRKITTGTFYLLAAGAMYMMFRSSTFSAILAGEVVTMFAYQAARTATSTIAAELFPTEIRATGYCMCVQVLGQLCWTLSPAAIGLLSGPMGGLGNAASIFAAGPLVGFVLVMLLIPETKGKSLEEISPADMTGEP